MEERRIESSAPTAPVKPEPLDTLSLEYPVYKDKIMTARSQGITDDMIRSRLQMREQAASVYIAQDALDQKIGRTPETKAALLTHDRNGRVYGYYTAREGKLTSQEIEARMDLAESLRLPESTLINDDKLYTDLTKTSVAQKAQAAQQQAAQQGYVPPEIQMNEAMQDPNYGASIKQNIRAAGPIDSPLVAPAQALGRGAKAIMDPVFNKVVAPMYGSTISGTTRMAGALGYMVDWLNNPGNVVNMDSDTLRAWRNKLYDIARAGDELGGGTAASTFGPEGPDWMQKISMGIGSSLPSFAMGAVMAPSNLLASAAAQGWRATSDAFGEAAAVHRQMLDEGRTEEEARSAANKTAVFNLVLNAALEKFVGPFSGVGQYTPGVKGRVLRGIISSTGEFGQESLQDMWSNAIVAKTEDGKPITLGQALSAFGMEAKNFGKYMRDSGLPAFFSSFILTGLLPGASRPSGRAIDNMTAQGVSRDGRAVDMTAAERTQAAQQMREQGLNVQENAPITPPRETTATVQEETTTETPRTEQPITGQAVDGVEVEEETASPADEATFLTATPEGETVTEAEAPGGEVDSEAVVFLPREALEAYNQENPGRLEELGIDLEADSNLDTGEVMIDRALFDTAAQTDAQFEAAVRDDVRVGAKAATNREAREAIANALLKRKNLLKADTPQAEEARGIASRAEEQARSAGVPRVEARAFGQALGTYALIQSERTGRTPSQVADMEIRQAERDAAALERYTYRQGRSTEDPVASKYITPTEGSLQVPVDGLRLTEDVTPESLGRAKQHMREATEGSREKRAPLIVVDRGDGTFSVIDGNNTLEALREAGAQNVPVEVRKPYQKGVTDMESLYAQATEAQPEFEKLMRDLNAELGGELLMRKEMKGQDRVTQKVESDYGGDYGRVIDVLAGSLIFDTEEDLAGAFKKLQDDPRVVRIKDKWSKPEDTGYRDMNLSVRLPNGHVAELQLHHRGILDAKNGLGHLLYEFMRMNKANNGMDIYTEQAKTLSRAVYEAGLNGTLQTMDASLMASALEIARALSSQTSTLGPETSLRELSGIILKTLPPSTAQRDSSLGSPSENSTANGTSSPFSKYLNANLNTSVGKRKNGRSADDIAQNGQKDKGNRAETYEQSAAMQLPLTPEGLQEAAEKVKNTPSSQWTQEDYAQVRAFDEQFDPGNMDTWGLSPEERAKLEHIQPFDEYDYETWPDAVKRERAAHLNAVLRNTDEDPAPGTPEAAILDRIAELEALSDEEGSPATDAEYEKLEKQWDKIQTNAQKEMDVLEREMERLEEKRGTARSDLGDLLSARLQAQIDSYPNYILDDFRHSANKDIASILNMLREGEALPAEQWSPELRERMADFIASERESEYWGRNPYDREQFMAASALDFATPSTWANYEETADLGRRGMDLEDRIAITLNPQEKKALRSELAALKKEVKPLLKEAEAWREGVIAIDEARINAILEKAKRLGLEKEAETYRQQAEQDANRARIRFTPEGKAIIDIFSARDASSLFHELGHKILYDFTQFAEREGVSEQYRQDAKTAFEYLGITPEEFLTDADRRVAAHEKFAKSFEAYLAEGKAPSREMRGVFKRMKAWLIDIYRNVSQVLGVELNDEIRGVFDRLLATQEQIDAEYEAQTRVGELAVEHAALREEIKRLERKAREAGAEGLGFVGRETLRKLKEKQKADAVLKREIATLVKDLNRMADSETVKWERKQEIAAKLVDYDLKRRRKDVLERRAELESYLAENPDAAETMNPNDLKYLGARTLNDMTIEDLRNLNSEVRGMYEQGQREFVEWEAQRKQRIDEKFAALAKTLMKKKVERPLIQMSVEDTKKQYKGVRGALEKSKDWGYAATLGGQRFFDWLDGGGAKYQGAFVKYFMDEFNAARDLELNHTFERRDWMQAELRKLGLDMQDFSKVRARNIYGKDFTVDQIMEIYIGMRNEKKAAAILYGVFGQTPDSNGVVADLISRLSDDEKRAAELVPIDHDMNVERIDGAFIKAFNRGMNREENYTSIHRIEHGSPQGVIDAESAEALANGMADAGFIKRIEDGFTKSRVEMKAENQTGIKLGLFSNWHDDVGTHEHAAAFAELARETAGILMQRNPADNRITLGKMIQERFGDQAWRTLVDYFNIAVTDDSRTARGVLDGTASYLAKNMSIAYLCGNLGTVIKQTTSIPRFLITAGPHRLLASIGKFMINPQQFLDAVYEMDPQMRDRQGSALLRAIRQDPNWGTRLHQRILDIGMEPISTFDRWVAAIGWRATFDANFKNLGRDGAIREAQRAVALTQQTAHAKDAPAIWRQNGLARLAMVFTSDAAQTFGMTAYDFAQQMRTGQIMKATATLLGLTLSAMLMKAATDGIPWDDDEDETTGLGWVASAFTEQFIEAIPLIGKELMLVYDRMAGRYRGSQYSAIVAPLDKIARAAKIFTDEDYDEEEDFWRGTWNALEGLSLTGIAPLPVTGIKRVVQSSKLWLQDGEPLDAALNMVGRRPPRRE